MRVSVYVYSYDDVFWNDLDKDGRVNNAWNTIFSSFGKLTERTITAMA